MNSPLVVQEIEDKAPLLKKQREDYEISLRSIDQMTRQLDAAMLVSKPRPLPYTFS